MVNIYRSIQFRNSYQISISMIKYSAINQIYLRQGKLLLKHQEGNHSQQIQYQQFYFTSDEFDV